MDDVAATEVPPAAEEGRFLHERSNSTGRIGGSCIRQPVASRFMRASMGSCHDLCKHGMRNVADTNKESESLSRKKSRDFCSRSSVNGESTGHVEDGGGKRGAASPRVGNEKGSSPRIGSDRTLPRAASNARKARLDVHVPNFIKGKGLKASELRVSETNLADVHDPASLSGPSSTKKPKLTAPSPEIKRIGRSRSGGNLIRAPLFLSSSSPERLSLKEGKPRTIVRKGLVLDNKDNLSKRLSFRRVTSLERRPDDDSLRRLRFRRPMSRDLQATSSNENVWRNIRRVEPLGVAGEVKSRKHERVILRHRSMEKRQEGRRLFNNVIEETARKLVKSQKSKVKALVGAFETVISLQDKKVQVTC